MNTSDRLDLSPTLTPHQALMAERVAVSDVHHRRAAIIQAWMAETGLPPSQCATLDLTTAGVVAKRSIVVPRNELELMVNARELLDAASHYHLLMCQHHACQPMNAAEGRALIAHQDLGRAILACMPKPKDGHA